MRAKKKTNMYMYLYIDIVIQSIKIVAENKKKYTWLSETSVTNEDWGGRNGSTNEINKRW